MAILRRRGVYAWFLSQIRVLCGGVIAAKKYRDISQ
jgi:hypothetical protein